MKYLLKTSVFIIIHLVGFLKTIQLIEEKSWWALFAFIVWLCMAFIWEMVINTKKCPHCGKKGTRTGIAGTRYKQWHCQNCNRTFWTTLFLEKYEI